MWVTYQTRVIILHKTTIYNRGCHSFLNSQNTRLPWHVDEYYKAHPNNTLNSVNIHDSRRWWLFYIATIVVISGMHIQNNNITRAT